MHGLYHLTSPVPVRNSEVMATFRKLLGQRIGLPSPAWLTRIGAPLLGSDPELALTGRRVYPQRLLDEGFEFTERIWKPLSTMRSPPKGDTTHEAGAKTEAAGANEGKNGL